MKILVLNAGSSSLKCELYEADPEEVSPEAIWDAQADWKQLPGPASIRIRGKGGTPLEYNEKIESLEHSVEHLLGSLVRGGRAALRSFDEISIVGHRVVHGGDRYRHSTRLTADVRVGIRELAPFAPLHNPLALAVIQATDKVLGPTVSQIAVFDTSFHATLPPESYLYPGPKEWATRGLRRYGFHGISHQYLSRKAAAMLMPVCGKPASELRVITCHLGNGCSLCALKGGVSVETTMGFTPLEGLMMGSRSGTVDPGLLLYLMKHDGCTADELDQILNHRSGLEGLSGVSSDMRQVMAAAGNGDSYATQALAVYIYRLAYFISALVPALGGLDGLVFAGGIGENSSEIRQRTCDLLSFLGISIDSELNRQSGNDRFISAKGSKPAVAVIRTRENYQIALECLTLIGTQ
ncbi:MAG: acetate kinase [Bryobacteraceae bacterium]